MLTVVITLAIVVLVAGAIRYLSGGHLEQAAQMAHVVEGLAVVGALSFAGFEYWLHQDAETAKQREAAMAILSRSYDPRNVDGSSRDDSSKI